MAEVLEAIPSESRPPVTIAQPKLEKDGLGYIASFPLEGVRVAVESLRNSRDGLTADLTVETGPVSGDGDWVTLTSGRLAMSSISGREQWERRLARRDGDPKRWGRVLDGLCAAVLRAERRLDAPAIYLRDAQDPPATQMAIAPLVLANLTTLWFGPDGALKSYALLAAALAMHTGLPLLGAKPSRTQRVGFVNFEPFGEGEHKRRMRRLLCVDDDFPDGELPDLVYVDSYGSTLTDQVERLQRVVRDHQLEFIVLDSIGFAADGPLNEDETARRFWQCVGQIGRPMLADGHTPKAGDELFGSRFWRAGSRLAWHVTKYDGSAPNTAILRFACQKVSVDASLAPVALAFDFSDDETKISTTSAHRADGDQLHQRLAAILHREQRPVTYAELALALGEEDNRIRRSVSEHSALFTVLDPLPGARQKRVALRAPQEDPND